MSAATPPSKHQNLWWLLSLVFFLLAQSGALTHTYNHSKSLIRTAQSQDSSPDPNSSLHCAQCLVAHTVQSPVYANHPPSLPAPTSWTAWLTSTTQADPHRPPLLRYRSRAPPVL